MDGLVIDKETREAIPAPETFVTDPDPEAGGTAHVPSSYKTFVPSATIEAGTNPFNDELNVLSKAVAWVGVNKAPVPVPTEDRPINPCAIC